MLRGVVICPDRELGDRLVGAILESHQVGIVRRMESYPNAVELGRFMRAAAPEILFLSIESRQESLEIARQVEDLVPGIQIVAINRTCDPPTLLETMQAGIREFLSPPFELQPLNETLRRIGEKILQNPPLFETTDSVFAFLPAKAGCGATTIAVNASLALSKMTPKSVLLADLDLNSGLVGFMLRLTESLYSIVDAAENAMQLDENLWPKIVSSKDNLDILPVGGLSPGFRIETDQIRHILSYARRQYSAICVDLSGMMERYSVEILHEAKRVFLVTTSELPALHLAREKLAFLRSQDLDSRVSILLNRSQKRGQISLKEMETLFGMPVFMTFPNDYIGVHKALTDGRAVSPSSPLGVCFRDLAETMVNKKAAAPVVKRGLMDLLARRAELKAT
jgi:Flp pilus assembly protein, ATPase CpaE